MIIIIIRKEHSFWYNRVIGALKYYARDYPIKKQLDCFEIELQ